MSRTTRSRGTRANQGRPMYLAGTLSMRHYRSGHQPGEVRAKSRTAEVTRPEEKETVDVEVSEMPG